VSLDAVLLEGTHVREAAVAGVALVRHDLVLLPAVAVQMVEHRVAGVADVALVLLLALVAQQVRLERLLGHVRLVAEGAAEAGAVRVVRLHVLEQHVLAGEPLAALGAHERFAVRMGQHVLLQVALAVGAPTADVAALGARVGKVRLAVQHQRAVVLEQLAANLARVLAPQVAAVHALDVEVEAVAGGVRLGTHVALVGTLAGVQPHVVVHRRLRLERLAALRALEDGLAAVLQPHVSQQLVLELEAPAARVAPEPRVGTPLLGQVQPRVLLHQRPAPESCRAPCAVVLRS